MARRKASPLATAEDHRRELHLHCYRMLGSFEDAEDAVQETYLRAWRRAEGLGGVENLRAWLYKVATNACLDQIKAKKRRLPSLESFRDLPWLEPYPDQLLDRVAPAAEEPERSLVARETIELTFLAVIQLLPPRQRAALILRDVLGWSADEAAELLEIGIAATNSALQRARATVQQHLPTSRRQDWGSADTSAAERDLLDGFIAAHESGDVEATMALIANDVRVTMPPAPYLFEGREAIASLVKRAASTGEWRLVPTASNRMPAAASYLRSPGETEFKSFKIDVLRVVDGLVAEITTFGAKNFPAFDLPETLP